MKIEKLLESLRKAHSPIPLAEFMKVAKHFGFTLDHITGSHFVFRNWTGKKYSIPVHHQKIKAVYVRNFIKEQE